MSITIIIDLINKNECSFNIIVSGRKSGIFRFYLYRREKGNLEKFESIILEYCENNNWVVN
jgi:hypothetical protein